MTSEFNDEYEGGNNEILELQFKMFYLHLKDRCFLHAIGPLLCYAEKRDRDQDESDRCCRVLHQCHQHSEVKYEDTREKIIDNYALTVLS